MKTKTMRIIALSGLAILVTAALAFAQPGYGRGGWGAGGCPGYGQGNAQVQNLTPEQQAKLDQLFTEHRQQMFNLRQEIWAKQTELNALSNNPNTKPERISQLVSEIKDLRARQYNEREAFQATLQKEGLPMGYGNCAGFGGGPRGGRGMMRGGAW